MEPGYRTVWDMNAVENEPELFGFTVWEWIGLLGLVLFVGGPILLFWSLTARTK